MLDGYDHIIDIIDEDGVPISEAANQANQPDTVAFLHSILAFEVRFLINLKEIFCINILKRLGTT